MRGFNPFQWFAREVDEAGLGILDAPEPEDAKPIPPPYQLLVTDAQQVASLSHQLNAANAHVARLQEQLLARPAVSVADRHCSNCAGMEQTIRLLQDERRDLRRRLTAHELAATREQGWTPPPAFAET